MSKAKRKTSKPIDATTERMRVLANDLDIEKRRTASLFDELNRAYDALKAVRADRDELKRKEFEATWRCSNMLTQLKALVSKMEIPL